MTADLLTSKLFIPPLRHSLVPRQRLVQVLNEGLQANRKLTLVSAPAGFGKTTLVVDWLQQSNFPAAWVSLDEAENDLSRFLAYLAAALHHVDEEAGSALQSALQSPQLPEIEKALAGMLNEIAHRTNPLILVLDDYHLLSEAQVLKGIAYMLDHQPPQLHIVITTREDPDLPLARLRARNQLTEIRAGDLRFNRDESETFLRSVMGLEVSEQDVAALEGRTEGWAAGLQLAGLSMQKQADLKVFIKEFSGTHRHILDYLSGEVLQQQPEEIRTFLLQTSILDRLSGPLCDAVTGRHGSAELLRHLENANLFVIPLDEERCWYRYHHLFADLLRSQLMRTHPEWVPGLHRNASCWYEENGDVQAAVEHALKDTDSARAAHLVEKHSIPILYQGKIPLVAGWFGRLPSKLIETSPMLCIDKAWSIALMHRPDSPGEVEKVLQQAELALDQSGASQELRDLVRGHSATLRAFVQPTSPFSTDHAKKIIALFQEAHRLLPASEEGIRSVIALHTAYGYMELVDLEAAGLYLRQTLEYGLSGGNYYAAIYGPATLGHIAMMRGDLKEALQLCNTNITHFNHILAGQSLPPIGVLYLLKGLILFEFNRLEEVAPALLEGLDMMHWFRDYESQRKGYAALARLYAIRGDRAAMTEALKTLEDAWPENALFAHSQLHRLSITYWPADPQVQRDAQAWLTQSRIDFHNLAVISSVKPNTDILFDGYLNAAHILARLAMAKPGAYEISGAQEFLGAQAAFAESHGIVSRFVAASIAKAMLYTADGNKDDALGTLEAALRAAAPTGLFRVFVNEDGPMQDLLVELTLRLKDPALAAYASSLLDAFTSRDAKPENGDKRQALLSERELAVLQNLSIGHSYEETGQKLFLSLNTVQFHVKNIYRKLLVNKREQAILKARELKLI